jgi:hypothetical protein
MCSASTVSDATSADKSSIGFDYQYYFFLWKILCLHPGQSAGLEYKDDVHTDLDNDIQVLYQLKHTVQKSKATGKPSNLTSLDLDLWKTLFNWAQLIQDESAGRALPNEQLNFLQKTIFVLASNKSETRNNTVASFIDDITNGEIHPSNIRDKFSQLTKDSKSKDIGKYSEKILLLSNDVLYNFFKCVKFELEQDDIIKKCHDAIKSKMIEDRHIESVFKLIDSSIKENNFITIKANSKVVISFDEFHKRYRKYFQQFQNSDLKIYEFEESLPSGMESLTFIKQLIEINDFDADDLDTIVEFTSLMLKAQTNINNWYSNGELTDIELSSLKQNTLTDWKNSWRRKYRNFDESSHNTLALDLVDSMRSKTITYDVLPNDITISNGYLYYLSETPNIGWRKDWEKYKK